MYFYNQGARAILPPGLVQFTGVQPITVRPPLPARRTTMASLHLDAISKTQNFLSYAFTLSLAMAHESYVWSGG